MKSTYFGWPGRFLFVGRGGRSDLHAHIALQVVISLDRPARLRQQTTDPYETYQACIIAPHASHQLVMVNRDLPGIILWLDPRETTIARWQPPQPITPLDVTPSHLTALRELTAQPDCGSAHRIMQFIAEDILNIPPQRAPDSRIQAVCARIDALVFQGEPPGVDGLAAEVSLSPSRLMHLFKEEMGLPIRRYVLWRRKLLAIALLAQGASLTEAAYRAGFADSAHLTRTYRQMSGVSPSEVWKNSSFVQVIDCSSA